MPKCYICNYYDPRQMSLYRVPDRNDEYSERSRLWLKLLDEKVENVHKIRICSKHFLQKKPAKSGDHLDLDWVPNKDLGRFSKNWKLIEYYFRNKQKTLLVQSLSRPEKKESYQTLQNKTDNNDQTHFVKSYNFIGKAFANSDYLTNSIVDGKTKEVNNDSSNKGDYLANVAAASIANRASIKSNNYQPYDVDPLLEEATVRIRTVGPNALHTVLLAAKKRIPIIKIEHFSPKAIQTDLSIEDIDALFKYYQEAVEERNELLTKIATLVIDFDYFKGNNKKTRFYTGLPTWLLFNNLFEMIKEFLPNHFNSKLSSFQMLTLTLMKLRLNLSFTDLGYRFRIDETTASRYFHRCIFILFKLFNNSKLVHWPDQRQNLLLNVPSYFRSTFKECITIIVDCFEIFTERPSLLRAAAQGFSHYKHHLTLKFLIGISVTGVILFVSIGFGGRTSDKEVVSKSGFLNKIQEGDVVLGDKGFLIEDELKGRKASLKRPSFVKKGCQLHPTEVEQSRDYARIRIHVERVICVLREKFNICADLAQISAIAKQNDLFDRDLYDKIIFICSCLTNICPSVVPNYFEM